MSLINQIISQYFKADEDGRETIYQSIVASLQLQIVEENLTYDELIMQLNFLLEFSKVKEQYEQCEIFTRLINDLDKIYKEIT